MLEEYKAYTRVDTAPVIARKVVRPELVKTYNGVKTAQPGDYVVRDDEGRVMLCQGRRFEHRYVEVRSVDDGDRASDSQEAQAT